MSSSSINGTMIWNRTQIWSLSRNQIVNRRDQSRNRKKLYTRTDVISLLGVYCNISNLSFDSTTQNLSIFMAHLTKPTNYDIKDSNIALLGSDVGSFILSCSLLVKRFRS